MSTTGGSVNTSDVLFTVKKNCTSLRNFKTRNATGSTTPASLNATEALEQQFTILCVLWKNGKLGAAYFKTDDQQLYFLQETVDYSPDFTATRSLCREVEATHTITIANSPDLFIKCLLSIVIKEDEEDNGSESVSTRTIPPNMSLLNYKEYSFQNCEYKLHSLSLPSEPESATSTQRQIFLNSLVNFDCKMSVHSLGALIKYVEQNWSYFNPNEKELKFMHINQISLNDNVLIDKSTFEGLNIFQNKLHDSNYHHRGQELNSVSERSFSIFKLLSQHCKSKLGYSCMRYLMRNPTKDIKELNKRLDFIEFALIPDNQGFIKSLQDNIKKLSDVNMILRKIQYSVANGNDWETLYNTIFSALFLHELCLPYEKFSSLFSSLNAAVTPKLYELQFFIYSALDFTQRNKENRPTIKFGLDDELDAKELRKQDIAKTASAAAQITINQLPNYLNECSIVYIPNMGHYVSIAKWEPNCNYKALESYGFHFVFETNNYLHYKNPMCYELDKQLGNIYLDILAHQNRIIERLSDLVLRYNKDIRDPLKIIGLIDCLISMSHVVKKRDYVRPLLNQNSIYEIIDGRNPLMEVFQTNFVSNSFYSGGGYSRIKVLTGPNDSGKSVFLKQIALLIYLAHIGCYVPAKKANIGITSTIHSRIYGTESAIANFSAFMLDISHTSQCLHNTRKNSIILIDEFGRGTNGDDGLALLAAALKKFVDDNESKPHVLVSTHFQQICNYLPKSQEISYIKTDYEKREPDELVYLYKVVDGISNSFTFDVASIAGLDISIINRAKEFCKMLLDNNPVQVQNNVDWIDLLNVNIPEPDP